MSVTRALRLIGAAAAAAATQLWRNVTITRAAIWPPQAPEGNKQFPRGSREYQFFRATLKWLESEQKCDPGTLSKFLQEAEDCEDGMMNWKMVFSGLRPHGQRELYRAALEKVVETLRCYAYSDNKDERRMYQVLAQVAMYIRDNRGNNTGHGSVTEVWKGIAEKMDQLAKEGAKTNNEKVEEVMAPTPELVKNTVGFAEPAEVMVKVKSVKPGEIIAIAAIILLL